ncbi:MAG: hemerythrin domain-containing protein [Bacteroidetes bacterium]|nr:hemerythrin domain-containing protein [Bacteroidota bacterium]
MRRHESLITLSREHHEGLIIAQLIKKDAPVYFGLPSDVTGKSDYVVKFYYNNLKYHFEIEEEKLFPLVNNVDIKISSVIKELIEEHKQIINFILTLKENKHDELLLNDLGVLLEKHIRKEERVLFEMLQNKLNEDQLQKIKNVLSE